jgi:hypothetical protein
VDSEPSLAQGAPQVAAPDPFFRILRTSLSPDAPVEGTMSIDGTTLFTLENPWQDNRPSVSCIPNGTYQVVLAWSNRFNRLMPRLVNVPGRTGILIHPGNTIRDTSGCILIGTIGYNGGVYNSAHAFIKFFDWFQMASRNGIVTCEIAVQNDWSAT